MRLFGAVSRNVVLLVFLVGVLVLFSSYVERNNYLAEEFRYGLEPLPETAVVVSSAPPNGWTIESYLKPDAPHLGVSFGSKVDEVDSYHGLAGHEANTALFFKTWENHPEFKSFEFNRLARRNVMPILSWEPWDNRKGVRQDQFRLRSIVDGEHDDVIDNWARGIALLDYPVVIRFAHEMNGHWYPWSAYANGNSPEDFVDAWVYIHSRFEQRGAANVIWCWSVNVNRLLPNRPFVDYYPGDEYVDIVGISGYSVRAGDTFDQVYGSTFSELAELTSLPVLVTELGVGGARETRASRMASVMTGLSQEPSVLGYVWFQKAKREDWRIDFDSDSLVQYRDSSRSFAEAWLGRESRSGAAVSAGLRNLGFDE